MKWAMPIIFLATSLCLGPKQVLASERLVWDPAGTVDSSIGTALAGAQMVVLGRFTLNDQWQHRDSHALSEDHIAKLRIREVLVTTEAGLRCGSLATVDVAVVLGSIVDEELGVSTYEATGARLAGELVVALRETQSVIAEQRRVPKPAGIDLRDPASYSARASVGYTATMEPADPRLSAVMQRIEMLSARSQGLVGVNPQHLLVHSIEPDKDFVVFLVPDDQQALRINSRYGLLPAADNAATIAELQSNAPLYMDQPTACRQKS